VNATAGPWLSPARGLLVFTVLAWAYLVNYAFRVVNAVVAPELASELALTPSQLGLLSSA